MGDVVAHALLSHEPAATLPRELHELSRSSTSQHHVSRLYRVRPQHGDVVPPRALHRTILSVTRSASRTAAGSKLSRGDKSQIITSVHHPATLFTGDCRNWKGCAINLSSSRCRPQLQGGTRAIPTWRAESPPPPPLHNPWRIALKGKTCIKSG